MKFETHRILIKSQNNRKNFEKFSQKVNSTVYMLSYPIFENYDMEQYSLFDDMIKNALNHFNDLFKSYKEESISKSKDIIGDGSFYEDGKIGISYSYSFSPNKSIQHIRFTVYNKTNENVRDFNKYLIFFIYLDDSVPDETSTMSIHWSNEEITFIIP